MAATYTTKAGDMLDEIAFKHYGSTANRVVEQVLEANPGLADLGSILPLGVRIALPSITAPSQSQGRKLWD